MAELDLSCVPSLDFRLEPEAGSTTAEVEDRSRHVRIAPEVEADRVAVGEPEDPRHVVGVNEVIQRHSSRHAGSLVPPPDVRLRV